jgi:undecaprenyl-diphosphatase
LPRRREQFLTHPARTLVEAAALCGLVAALAIFIPDGPLTLDSRWSELMQDIRTPFLTHLGLVFNALGRGLWRGLTLAAIGLVLLVARRWAALIAFAATEALTPVLGNLVKALVKRARPPGHMLTAHGSSFPSGHAAYAAGTAVALVLLFTRLGRDRPLWWALVAVITAGTAWSRTYLQVHWLSDVIAGASLGIAVAAGSFGAAQIVLARSVR